MQSMRLRFLFKQRNGNNFQTKVPVTVTRCDVHDPLLVSGQLFAIIVLSRGLAKYRFLQSYRVFIGRETCVLENEKGLGPVIKMQLSTSTAFIVLESKENGSTGKKKIVRLYRCVEIAQVSVGSPGNYWLRELLTCSSPSNSTIAYKARSRISRILFILVTIC